LSGFVKFRRRSVAQRFELDSTFKALEGRESDGLQKS
jgi:hypothetical protein